MGFIQGIKDGFNEGLYEREKRRREKAERKLAQRNRLISYLKKQNKQILRDNGRLRAAGDELAEGYVVAFCKHCETQAVMIWEPETEGCLAFCPHCGERMMLCDYCEGECDYNYGTDVCKEM